MLRKMFGHEKIYQVYSYRSRERRGVISQKETQFYSKAQQIRSQELE